MYLSRVELDPTRRSTMAALAAPQKLHGAVESAFAGERRRRLWRLDRLGERLYLLLLSEDAPELSGVVAESSEEMQKAMEDGKSTYDMFASAMEGLVTINVVYEDLGALYGKLLDEAGYLEIAVPKLEDALASMGLSNVKVEQTPVQFAGLVREGAVISGEMDGVPMYETLVCIKQEGYMCCVTMCSWTEDITADLAELFYQA
mgnify:CR=1 FL=1